MTLVDVHRPDIERADIVPGQTPHFVRTDGSERGVLYVPASSGRWRAICFASAERAAAWLSVRYPAAVRHGQQQELAL